MSLITPTIGEKNPPITPFKKNRKENKNVKNTYYLRRKHTQVVCRFPAKFWE